MTPPARAIQAARGQAPAGATPLAVRTRLAGPPPPADRQRWAVRAASAETSRLAGTVPLLGTMPPVGTMPPAGARGRAGARAAAERGARAAIRRAVTSSARSLSA